MLQAAVLIPIANFINLPEILKHLICVLKVFPQRLPTNFEIAPNVFEIAIIACTGPYQMVK